MPTFPPVVTSWSVPATRPLSGRLRRPLAERLASGAPVLVCHSCAFADWPAAARTVKVVAPELPPVTRTAPAPDTRRRSSALVRITRSVLSVVPTKSVVGLVPVLPPTSQSSDRGAATVVPLHTTDRHAMRHKAGTSRADQGSRNFVSSSSWRGRPHACTSVASWPRRLALPSWLADHRRPAVGRTPPPTIPAPIRSANGGKPLPSPPTTARSGADTTCCGATERRVPAPPKAARRRSRRRARGRPTALPSAPCVSRATWRTRCPAPSVIPAGVDRSIRSAIKGDHGGRRRGAREPAAGHGQAAGLILMKSRARHRRSRTDDGYI